MLLYLTSNQKSNLIDPAVRNMTLPAKKLVGRFSLKSFVTKDMRNYANAKFFVVDAACIEESGNDFTLALQSFQMMFSARIIVILSGCEDVNGEVQRLLSIGVVNLVMRGTSPHGNKSLLFPFQTPCRTESSKTIAPVYICLQIKLYNFSKTWSRTQKSLTIWRGFGAMDRLLC